MCKSDVGKIIKLDKDKIHPLKGKILQKKETKKKTYGKKQRKMGRKKNLVALI